MDMGLVSSVRLMAWSWDQLGGRPFGSSKNSPNCFKRCGIEVGISWSPPLLPLAWLSNACKIIPLVPAYSPYLVTLL